MWETTRNCNMIDNDNDNNDEQNINDRICESSDEIYRLPSLPTQSSLAPLLSFDEYDDIPSPVINELPCSTSQQNATVNYRCCLCSWKRFRKDFCRIFTQFLFSQFGLIILVFIYTIFGGLLFYAIESNYESHKIEQIKIKHLRGIHNIRQIVNEEFNWMLNVSFELRYALWRGISSRLDNYDDTGWRVQVSTERFDRLIDDELARMQAEQEKFSDKHDTRTDAAYNQKWTFSTAMLYSATVITTVGYGNIAPKSILGKLITCLYAMIGIPIMIMYLTNTGDLLAYIFIKYYSITSHYIHRKIRQRKTKLSLQAEKETIQYHVPIAATLSVLTLYVVAGAILFSHWEGWSYIDSAYFSFITFTTIGLGDLVPGKGTLTDNKNGKSILCALYLLYGLVLTTMCFKLMQDDLLAFKQRIIARLGFYHYHYMHHKRQHRVHLSANNT